MTTKWFGRRWLVVVLAVGRRVAVAVESGSVDHCGCNNFAAAG